MHELAITQSILDIAVSEAEKRSVLKVLSIKIKLGEFSGIVPQLIQEYFNIVSRDTVAANAELIIEKVPVTIKCLVCGTQNKISRTLIKCPVCGSSDIKMLTGREFFVDSLEVE
ncbi:MAG: hydrogenase maturation nickel metallochaperone HypA [Oscillospiraceae bacterium]